VTTYDHVPRRRGSLAGASTDNTTTQLRAQQARILAEALHPATQDVSLKDCAGKTARGDARRMRGVPIQARGVGGTSPGTNPEGETINRSQRHYPRTGDPVLRQVIDREKQRAKKRP
jgi:hypothetical protein